MVLEIFLEIVFFKEKLYKFLIIISMYIILGFFDILIKISKIRRLVVVE